MPVCRASSTAQCGALAGSPRMMELSLCASSTVRLCLSLGFGRGMDMGEQGFLATSPSSTAWFMIWESFWWTRCSLLSVAPSLRILE